MWWCPTTQARHCTPRLCGRLKRQSRSEFSHCAMARRYQTYTGTRQREHDSVVVIQSLNILPYRHYAPPTRVNGEGPGNNRDSLHASGPPLSCHAMCWGHHRQGEIWDRGNPCWHAKSPKREFPAPSLTLPDCSVAATLSSHTRTPAGCRHPSPSAELPAGPDSRNTPGISHPPGDRQLASAGR